MKIVKTVSIELTEEERDKANSVADEVISYWEGEYFNENRIG